jgi:RNase P subunit RPR2
MRADYVRALLEEIAPGQGVVYPVIHGVNVSTVYMTQVQKFLAEQPNGQFTVTSGNGDLNVRLNKEVKTVCHECGSPHFWVSVTEGYTAYIDPDKLKARVTFMEQRNNIVRCTVCNTIKDVKVHRYPEV